MAGTWIRHGAIIVGVRPNFPVGGCRRKPVTRKPQTQMTNSRPLQNPQGGLCICHLSSVICHIRSLISRYPVPAPLKLCRTSLIGVLLLMLHSVSAALDEVDETGVSGSSAGAESGQRVRELGRPLYRTFTRRDEGIVNKILTGVQDPRGLMVFGSINCVLEYDGQHWTSIPIPNRAISKTGLRQVRDDLRWRYKRARRSGSGWRHLSL